MLGGVNNIKMMISRAFYLSTVGNRGGRDGEEREEDFSLEPLEDPG